VLLVGEPEGDLRLVLRGDAPNGGQPLPSLPDDAARVSSGISLDLSDPWLTPLGVRGSPPRRLEACSAVLRARPLVGRRLLEGERPWCDVVMIDPTARPK
jgi:hypothetical protein